MDKLDKIIENICDFHSENDTLSFYRKVILCCYECLNLLDCNLIEEEEKVTIKQGHNIWINNYNSDDLNKLHIFLAKKFSTVNKTNDKRKKALEAVLCFLMPYEKWYPQEYERSNLLEYFVFYLKLSGVTEGEIYTVIINQFSDIL
jgi:hypothetical protein